jgi:hypothetical protein
LSKLIEEISDYYPGNVSTFWDFPGLSQEFMGYLRMPELSMNSRDKFSQEDWAIPQ